MLRLSSRRLLRDGTSILSADEAAKLLLKTGELPVSVRVEDCEDATKFDLLYGVSIGSAALEEPEVVPSYEEDCEADLTLFERLVNTYRDGTPKEVHERRIEEEFKYFVDNGYTPFLRSLDRLITTFRNEGVVWGVGRGSSCACYLFYLIGVHDVNPVRHEISFKEFSKE